MKTRPDAALLILAVGFLFSMAANLLWTWDGGVVRILGGALASLALPGAIHLWPRIPVRGQIMRWVRAVAMTGIAVMAAFTTFSHASELLVQHGETPLLATLYPVMTELLVVMGVLARHTGTTPPPAEKKSKPRQARAPSPAPAETTDKPSPEEWARSRTSPPTGAEIQLATGCSKGYAYKIAAKVRAAS